MSTLKIGTRILHPAYDSNKNIIFHEIIVEHVDTK